MISLKEKLEQFKENYYKVQQYGYSPLDNDSYKVAFESLSKIDQWASESSKIISEPILYPTSEGGIILDWMLSEEETNITQKEMLLCFEAYPELSFSYIVKNDTEEYEKRGVFTTSEELVNLFEWFCVSDTTL